MNAKTVEQKINELKAAKAAAAEKVCVEVSKCRWTLIKELKSNPGLKKVMVALDAFIDSDIALETFLEGDLMKE